MSQTRTQTTSWEERSVGSYASKFHIMNWTDGKLYRSKRGKLRKTSENRRRQKEYFARADERRARQKELEGKIPALYLSAIAAPVPGQAQPTKRLRDLYSNLPQTVDDFINEFCNPGSVGDASQPGQSGPGRQEVEEGPEKKKQKILQVPAPWQPDHLRPLVPYKKRRLREKKIIDWEAFRKERRETLSHIVQGRQELQKILHDAQNPPQSQNDVKIRIGSQEKRLGASSSIIQPREAIESLPRAPPLDPRAQRCAPVPSHKSSSDSESVIVSRRIRRKHQPYTHTMPRGTNGTDEPEVRSAVLSRSPSIQAPAPMRSVQQDLLFPESYNSEDTNSVLAQIAHPVPLVPPSQRSENNKWKNWLQSVGSASQTDKAAEGSMESIQWPRVSPGISEPFIAPREQAHSLPDFPCDPTNVPYDNDLNGDKVFDQLVASTDSSLILYWNDERPRAKAFLEITESFQPAQETSRRDNVHRYPPAFKARSGDVPTSAMAPQASDSEPSAEDPEDAWKAFVFRGSDSDEFEQEAFEDAKHDAVLQLRPSEPPESPYDRSPPMSDTSNPPMSEHASNIATIGTVYTNINLSSEPASGLYESEGDSMGYQEPAIITSSSLQPDTTHNSISEASDPSTECPTAVAEVISSVAGSEATVSSTSSGASDPIVATDDAVASSSDPIVSMRDSIASSSDPIASANGPGTSTASVSSSLTDPRAKPTTTKATTMAPPPPRYQARATQPGGSFQFAAPRLFVGRRSNPTQLRRPEPVQRLSMLRRGRSRPRKRPGDGRASIRALPNYNSDPIEEIEDEGGVPESGFGALEME